MKKTRFLAALLAALTTLSVMTACSTGDKEGETTASPNASENAETNAGLKDDLPDDLNYGGEEIVFIADDLIGAEKLTGDPVSDVIFERNKAVEERLGIKITHIYVGDAVLKMITAIKSNSDDYDVLADNCWMTAPRFTEGYFTDLRQTAYLDFDQVWWNQSFNEAVNYKGSQFAVIGDMLLSSYRSTYTTVFNKDLFKDVGEKCLYEYVDDGSWTLDKQASLVPLFHQDNGNNVQDLEGDIYGFVSNDFISVDPYWSACEVDIVRKNADGEYEWVFDTEKMHNMADKVLHLFYATDDAAYIEHDDSVAESTNLSVFSDGRAAMSTLTIGQLEVPAMRQMPQEYGVVPMPKYDEAQAEYHSQLHDAFPIVCIPTTVQGETLDMLSAVLEAMASTSYNLVRPVYYETTLRTKIAQDPQSSEMMDLIINSIHIDAGFVFSHSMKVNGVGFHQAFQRLIENKTNDSASRFKMVAAAAKKSLRVLNTKLDRVIDQQ